MQVWNSDSAVNLTSAPDEHQGFGRIALNTSLPTVLRASPRAGASALFIDENATGLVSGEEKNYSWVTFDSSVPFAVTLSWYDPPNSVAASKQLLHDLNLKVVVDAADGTTTTYYPNGLGEADEVNTVEKIVIENPGNLKIVLDAGTLTESHSQPYALVAVGAGVALHENESPMPTSAPTPAPSLAPTHTPTPAPSLAPTHTPTPAPTPAPSLAPTHTPTPAPSVSPTKSQAPINDDNVGIIVGPVVSTLILAGLAAVAYRKLRTKSEPSLASVGGPVKVKASVESDSSSKTLRAAEADNPMHDDSEPKVQTETFDLDQAVQIELSDMSKKHSSKESPTTAAPRTRVMM